MAWLGVILSAIGAALKRVLGAAVKLVNSPDKAVAIGLMTVAVAALIAFGWICRDAGRRADARRSAPIIAGLTADVASCKMDLAQRDAKLTSQNAEVERLKAEDEERARRAAADIRAAQAEAKAYQKKAERIAKAKPGPDLCQSARDLIVDALSEDR